MYETIRIAEKIRPKYIVWENVKNILSKKHIHNFNNYIESLNQLGYNSYYKVLNAKDYGMPQNRERVFTISIKKDIDKGSFIFPKPKVLEKKLKDLLEETVDEKYYLKDYQIEKILYSNFIQNSRRIQNKDYCDTLCARDWKDPKCIQIGNLQGGKWNKINESCRRVYESIGISPTIHTYQGGNTEPKILIRNATKKGYIETEKGDSINLSYPSSTTKRGRVGKQISHTLQCNDLMGVYDGRVRKLTPKECWRLMGFDDRDFEKAEKVNSNTQLYKQAGNSIVVEVLVEIFKNLFIGEIKNDRKSKSKSSR